MNNDNAEFQHHGIKGMRWGVRRFQYPDGRLTAVGRERYGVGQGRNSQPERAGFLLEFVAVTAVTIGYRMVSKYLTKRGNEKVLQKEGLEKLSSIDEIKKKSKLSTLESDVKDTNPNFKKSAFYQMNCTKATTAYELRRRGYDVEANPSKSGDLIRDPYKSFKGYKGQDVKGKISDKTALPKNIVDIAKTWGLEARGIIEVTYTGASIGHIFNIDVGSKGVRFVDAQTNEIFDSSSSKANIWATAHIGRVDNLEFTDNVLNHVKNKR